MRQAWSRRRASEAPQLCPWHCTPDDGPSRALWLRGGAFGSSLRPRAHTLRCPGQPPTHLSPGVDDRAHRPLAHGNQERGRLARGQACASETSRAYRITCRSRTSCKDLRWRRRSASKQRSPSRPTPCTWCPARPTSLSPTRSSSVVISVKTVGYLFSSGASLSACAF